jgi:hypothetical protein
MGVKCGLVTLEKECTLKASGNKVLMITFEPKKDVRRVGYYITMNFVIYTDHIMLLGNSNQGSYHGMDMW